MKKKRDIDAQRVREIYEELEGYSIQLKNVNAGYLHDSSVWESINNLTNSLIKATKSIEFVRFTILPKVRSDGKEYATTLDIKMKLSGILSLIRTRYSNKQEPEDKKTTSRKPAEDSAPATLYIKEEIIEGFKNKKDDFDYKKLLGLINELNRNYLMSNPYSCLSLIRATVDHISPLLGFDTFEEVVNNYKGSKTDKAYIINLYKDRPVSDDTLHRPISKNEDLIDMDNIPNKQMLNRLLQECLNSVITPEKMRQKTQGKQATPKKQSILDPNLRPLLRADITAISGGPDGNFLKFDLKNAGKGLAVVKEIVLAGDSLYTRVTTLGENEKSEVTAKIDGSELWNGKVQNPKLIVKYININGDEFSTIYDIQLENRADGFHIVESFTNPVFSVS